jgi:drug/metabolite transporter (DMT)-like permease
LHAAAALSPVVVLAVLAAAVVHAIWNAIMHGIKDQLVAFGLLGAGGALASVPLIALAAAPRTASWPYLAASVVIHLLYCVLLMRSYRFGEFSQVYPIARGTSPLVVTVLSAVFVHERLAPAEIAGVLVVSAGMATLTLGGLRRDTDRTAILAAIATGLTIASYTTVDGVGVRASHSAAGYTGWLMLLQSADMLIVAAVIRRRELTAQPRPLLLRGTAAGVLSLVAYGLVLWAQTRAPLAPVAALRETSVIFGALIGTLLFKEPFGRRRVIAAAIVAAGIVLLAG